MLPLPGASGALLGVRGGRREPRRVRASRDAFGTCCPQAAEGEVADTVEEAKAHVVVDGREAAVDEPVEDVDGEGRRHAERGHDVLDRGQRRPAGEARQRPQPPLVVREEQVVAPGDRRLQRPAARLAACCGVGEQREPVAEPPGDLRDRKDLGAGGGQLDGQRQAVQGPAHRLDRRPLAGLGDLLGERRPLAPRAVHEQGDRVRRRQRLHRMDVLPVRPQRDLAGGQHMQPRRGGEQVTHGLVQPVDKMLAGVQEQQELAAAEPVEDQRLRRLAQAHRLADAAPDRLPVAGRVEPGQPRAVREAGAAPDLDGEPGLAHPGGPHERHHALLPHQPVHRRQVRGAPDQCGVLRREVPARPRRDWAAGRGRTRRSAQLRVLRQDALLERPQPRAWVQPQLVGEATADPRVCCEGLGLASRPVQRGHQ